MFVGGEEAAGMRARAAQSHDLRRLLPLLRRLRPPYTRDAHCQVPRLASPDRYCYALLTLHMVACFLKDQSVELMQSGHLRSLNRWFEFICSLSSLSAVEFYL